jgi:hypothetical protein
MKKYFVIYYIRCEDGSYKLGLWSGHARSAGKAEHNALSGDDLKEHQRTGLVSDLGAPIDIMKPARPHYKVFLNSDGSVGYEEVKKEEKPDDYYVRDYDPEVDGPWDPIDLGL